MKVDQLLEHLQQQVNYSQPSSIQKNTSSPPCSTPTEQQLNGQRVNCSRASSVSTTPPDESLANGNGFSTDWATAFMRQQMFGHLGHLPAIFQKENTNGSWNTAPTPSINATLGGQLPAEPAMAIPSTKPSRPEHRKKAITAVPEDLMAQGLSAVGGCRQCARTFTDRLELIHHFCDHFPAIFYSFEELKMGGKKTAEDKDEEKISTMALESGQQKVVSDSVETTDPTNNFNPLELVTLMQQLTSYGNMFDSTGVFHPALQAPNTSGSPMMGEASNPTASAHTLVNGPTSQSPLLGSAFPSKHSNGKKKKKSSSHKLDKNHFTSESSFIGDQAKLITSMSSNSSFMSAGEESKSGVGMQRAMHSGGQSSSQAQDLPYHMCPHCCLTFAESQAFQDHLQTHSIVSCLAGSTAGFGSPFGFNDPSQHPKLVKCRFCNMRFSSTYRLTEHEKLHAQNCVLCNKIFMTVFDLNLHMGTHTGYTYDCKDCGKCFPCRKTLAEHNKSHRILLSTSSDENTKVNPLVPTTSSGFKPVSYPAIPFNNSSGQSTTLGNAPTPYNLDLSREDDKEEVQKKARETCPILANPSKEDMNSYRPESLFNSNPYFTELLSQNGQTTRKRRSRTGHSKRANGEKSRKQTTLVAVELNPEVMSRDAIAMATAITTNIQQLHVKKENDCDMETLKKNGKNENGMVLDASNDTNSANM